MSVIKTALIVALLPVLCHACSKQLNVVGDWSRCISDESLGVTGYEYIAFNSDSSFVVENELYFCLTDSFISCSYAFVTRIGGVWQTADDSIVMDYNPDTYCFKSKPSGFEYMVLNEDNSYPANADTIKNELASKLCDYYREVYKEVAASTVILSQIHILADSMLIGVNGNVELKWEKLKTKSRPIL